MKGYKIFLAWLCTVVLGSIGLPIWYITLENGSLGSHIAILEILGLILICIIISGLLSLPALITLIITNVVLNGKNLSLRKHFRKINVTHILAAIGTLLIINSIIFYNSYQSYKLMQSFGNSSMGFEILIGPLITFAMVILWYMFCAVICWALFFLKEIKEIRNAKIVAEEAASINTES